MVDYTHYSDIYVRGKITSTEQGSAIGAKKTMPTPSQETEGLVITYVGPTTTEFKQNHTYMCKEDQGTYVWDDITPLSSVPILEPKKAVVTDIKGEVEQSPVTSDELLNLQNSTSNIQDQLDDKTDYTMPIRHWNTDTTYLIDSTVIYNGNLYISCTDSNRGHIPGTDTNWKKIEGSGGQATGVSITFGNDTDTDYTLYHGLKTKNVVFSLRDDQGAFIFNAVVVATSDDEVTLTLSAPPGVDKLVFNVLAVDGVPPVPTAIVSEYDVTTPTSVWQYPLNTGDTIGLVQSYDGSGHIIFGGVSIPNSTDVKVDFNTSGETGRMLVISPTVSEVLTGTDKITHNYGFVGVQVFMKDVDEHGNPIDVELYTSVHTDSTGTTIGLTGQGDVTVAIVKPSIVREFTDSTIWTVQHTLGRYVGAYVYDENGDMMIADIQQDGTQVVVEFSTKTSGRLVII